MTEHKDRAVAAVFPISANFGPIEWGASGQVKRGTCNPMRKWCPPFSIEASLFLACLSYPTYWEDLSEAGVLHAALGGCGVSPVPYAVHTR